MAKPLHHGPIFPLAIMAMFALMVPVFFVANNANSVRTSEAARMRVPRKTPTPVMIDGRGMQTPTPSPESGAMYNY